MTPPPDAHSLESEESVLGSILIEADAFNLVTDVLDAEDFYKREHQLIFSAMRVLANDKKPLDVVTVEVQLKARDHSQAAGGIAYLGTLARNTPTSAHIQTYAQEVRSASIARRTKRLAQKLADSCDSGSLIAEVLGAAGRDLAALHERCADLEALRPRLASIDVHDFLSRELPARQHILEPPIPEQGIVMLHAQRGFGKTQLSVGIAVAVAAGGTFLKWAAPKPAGVLLIDGEMPAATMQKRLADAIQASAKEPQAPLRLITPDLNWEAGMPDLSTIAGQQAVDALVTEDIRLLIVDNLSSLVRSGVENDAESWLPLQTWALRHRAAGRSILFVHHSGKDGSQRGTSRREDVLDTVIALRRPTDYRQSEGARFEVHFEKGRSVFGKDANPFEAQLCLDQNGRPAWSIKELEANQEKQIAELSALGMKPAEIAQELSCSKATVYRRMQKANGKAPGEAEATGHA